MIAGTIAVLETTKDEPLSDSFAEGGQLPGLSVESTQTSFDDRPVQEGTVAGEVATTREDITVGQNSDGEAVAIDVDRVETRKMKATNFVADVTGSGLIVPESVAGDGDFDFPLGTFWSVCGSAPVRQQFNIGQLHRDWQDKDVLGDVWMVGQNPGDGASMNYHKSADENATATFGLGFRRTWDNSVMEGVVYASGYVAIYNTSHISRFIRFVETEILPHSQGSDEEPDPVDVNDEETEDDQQQAKLGGD